MGKEWLRIAAWVVGALIVGYLLGGWVYEVAGDNTWTAVGRWIRYYETIVAGGLAAAAALFAAGLAWRAVQDQLIPSRRQSAAAAADVIVKVATALEDEKVKLARARQDLRATTALLLSYDRDNRAENYQRWPKKADDLEKVCSSVMGELGRYADRNPQDGQLERDRIAAIEALASLRESISLLDIAFYLATAGPDHEEGQDDLKPGEEKRRREKVDADYLQWTTAAARLSASLTIKIQIVWKRIRELEGVVIE